MCKQYDMYSPAFQTLTWNTNMSRMLLHIHFNEWFKIPFMVVFYEVRLMFSSQNCVTSSSKTINSNINIHKWCRLICQYKRAVPLTNIDFYLIVEVDKGAECWACLDCVIKALNVLSFSFHVLWFVSGIQSKKTSS